MRTVVLLVVAVLMMAGRGLGEDFSPHRMVDADGNLDTAVCPICHEEDLTLARSKVETCTLCHPLTPHAGAAEHLRAGAATVTRLVPPAGEAVPELPLTDDGKMYCATCHLFHDPLLGEAPLAVGWVPPSSGVPGAVKGSVAEKWEKLARKYGQSPPVAKFVTQGTTALRLPVADGSLCRHCHGRPGE